VGADGSEYGVVNTTHDPALKGIECIACHNEGTVNMTSVVFPSGVEVTGLGSEARCMQCHQGRASKVTIDTTLEELGLTEDLDTVNEDLICQYPLLCCCSNLYGTITKVDMSMRGLRLVKNAMSITIPVFARHAHPGA
jgi:hypothetical protein